MVPLFTPKILVFKKDRLLVSSSESTTICVRNPVETTPDTGNHIREFIKQTECLLQGKRENERKRKGKRRGAR